MLGLGSSLTSGSNPIGALPPVSDLTLSVNFYEANTVDSSNNGAPSPASVSIGDLRFATGLNEYTGTASDYTVTKIEIRNNTVNPGGAFTTEFSGELTMDSVINFGGLGSVFIIFDNDSAMDDIDLGSSSGHPQAHNGTGSNSFSFKVTIQVKGYDGSKVAVRSNLSLNDSDA